MSRKTAICVIDAQHDFMDISGELSVPNAHKIKSTIAEIIKFGHDRNLTVYFTQDAHDGSEPEMKKNGGPFPFHCMVGTRGQENIEEAIPTKDEKVFTKQCYDVFDKDLGNKEIAKWVKDQGFTEVYLAGVATDYCVKAHALGLIKLGIETYVFEDAIAGVDEKTTANAIEEMKNAGVHFVRFVV